MYTETELHNIFSSFADPATTPEIVSTKKGVEISIVRNGEDLSIFIDKSTNAIEERLSKQRFINLNSLIASHIFADLKYFTEIQRKSLSTLDTDHLLEVSYKITPKIDPINNINNLDIFVKTSQKKNVILVDGAAGIGKTHLLRRMTWLRAKEYQKNQSLPPILYVDNRGKRLSNLNDTIASATQRIRAKFTFDQVPVLMNLGLIHLAIDGFDELVDSEGYKDAWIALRDFLSELNSNAVCIISGRDTFFDQQSFLTRLEAKTETVNLTHISLKETTIESAYNWLVLKGWQFNDQSQKEFYSLLKLDDYLLRPYFLNFLASYGSWDHFKNSIEQENFAVTFGARRLIVNSFIDREAKIISETVDITVDASKVCIRKMLEDIAMDMAERESNEIDLNYLEFSCEICFKDHLDELNLNKLLHKVGSFAFLENTNDGKNSLRRFPHSELMYYFLSWGMINLLSEKTIPLFLRRGRIDYDFIKTYQELIEGLDNTTLSKSLNFLKERIISNSFHDHLTSNGNTILIASLGSVPQVGMRA